MLPESHLGGEYHDVLIYFTSADTLRLSQRLVYTTASLASAAGGAMGMFLGWSLYQIHRDAWAAGEEAVRRLAPIPKAA